MTISFVTCVKNREASLRRLIESLQQIEPGVPFELVVADFNSDDADLGKLVGQYPDISLTIVRVSGYFNRSRGLNVSAQQANYSRLFFIDVDMLVPPNMVQLIMEKVQPGQCWFPICYSLHKNKPAAHKDSSRDASKANGWWRSEGSGMCGMMVEDFQKLGRWNEAIGKSYGNEDGDFCRRAGKLFNRIRDRCEGLFHVWHPVGEYRTRYHQIRNHVKLRPAVKSKVNKKTVVKKRKK